MKNKHKTTHNHNNTKTTKNTNKKSKNCAKKITNWSEYNKSLKNRGNLSIFISESLVKNGSFVMPQKTGKAGRPQKYSDALIEFMLTVRELFHLPLRQTAGFIEFLFKQMNLTSDIPDYTTISYRMPGIKIHYLRKVNQLSSSGIVMLIDSSGFKVFGEGEWMRKKHGATYRRTWRETHIALDYDTRDVIGFTNTPAHTHDITQLEPLLIQATQNSYKLNSVIGDGAYDSKDNYDLAMKYHTSIIAPPPKNAVCHYDLKDGKLIDIPGYEERNKAVRSMIRNSNLEEWKNEVDYHRRSLIENLFYRWKTIFGDHLKSRKEENQYTEQALRARIINKFNELGLPKYELAN